MDAILALFIPSKGVHLMKKTGLLGEIETAEFAGMTVRLIAGGDGPVTVMDMHVAQGGGAPDHKSFDEEKTFVLLAGRLAFRTGDAHTVLVPGAVMHVAKADVHGFTNLDPTPARVMLISTPARHDAFFRAMSALPVPHDPAQVRRVCATFRQEIVGL